MSQERSRFGSVGFAVLLLAGGVAILAGPAEAGRGFGFSGGFQGGGVVVRSPAHQGSARPMQALHPTPSPGTTVPVPPMQSGFLNQGFVPAMTPGFMNQGIIPPIAPGFLNEGFIPPIAPGFLNEGFIPPLVGSSVVTGHRFGFHRHTFRHHFAFGHRFAFRHCFAFGHCFGFHRHGFGTFAGFGFGDVFFGSPTPVLEIAEPEQSVGPGPSEPSADLEEEQDQEPVAAHDVQFHRPQHGESPAGRHEGSGKVVVMRPGFQDEVVTVPRDAGGG